MVAAEKGRRIQQHSIKQCLKLVVDMIGTEGLLRNESPIQQRRSEVLENLIAAEEAAEGVRSKLSAIIKMLNEENQDVSSMTSLALDVSQISAMKGTEPLKTQFASSPNLSGNGTVFEDMKKNLVMRTESASTSTANVKKINNKDGGMTSKPRRVSTGFKPRYSPSVKTDKPNFEPLDTLDTKKNNISLKPKPAPPTFESKSSPHLTATKKRLNYANSAIPRPTAKKD